MARRLHPLSRPPWIAVPVMFLGAAAVLAGCGKSAGDRATEAIVRAANEGRMEVEHRGDAVTFQGADGGHATVAQGGDLALPDDFPDDVYRPARHRVRSVMDLQGMQVIGLSTDGPLDTVREEASATMRANGWKQVMAMDHEGGGMLAYEKGRRHAALSFAEEGDEVMLSVQLREDS